MRLLIVFFLQFQVAMSTLSFIPDDMDYHTNFIYIDEKSFTFNEATQACASFNATLATMKSWQKWLVFNQLYNSATDWNFVPSNEAWIGLTNTLYGLNWVDCAAQDVNDFTMFKDAGDELYKPSEQCYRVKGGESFRWKQKKCEDALAVICEQRIYGGTPCNPQNLWTGDLIDKTTNNEDDCHNSCAGDGTCYGLIYYNNGSDTCIRLKKALDTPTTPVKMMIKHCVEGEIKSSPDVTLPISQNKDATPLSTCSNTIGYYTSVSTSTVFVTPTPSPSSVMPYSPECYNITVTEIYNFTTTVHAPSTVTVELTPSLSPSACVDRTTFINITNTKYIEEAVENITKALYVDKKQISSYVRSKTCAEDKRPSSATVGYFGIVFIAVPFALIFVLDLRSIFAQMRDTASHCQPCDDTDEEDFD